MRADWGRVGMFRPLILTLLPLFAGQLAAQGPIPSGAVREGTLSFDGHSSVTDFTGTTTAVTGEMSGGSDLGQVSGWVEAPIDSLKTGNERRDRDLNKSMETGKYPHLRFELTGVSPATRVADSIQATLRGRFIIHGVTREVELPGSVLFGQGQVRVRSDFPLNLKDYQIGGLTKFLGVLKMYPDIVVHVDVTFQLNEP